MSNSLNTISLAADVGLRRPIDPRTGDLTNPAGRPEALFFGETVTLAVDFFTRTPAGNDWLCCTLMGHFGLFQKIDIGCLLIL